MIYTGNTALVYAGLIQESTAIKDISSWRTKVDGCVAPGVRYLYNPNFDDKRYLRRLPDNSMTPIAERALVEYIQNEKHRDEFTIIWALQNYLNSEHKNMSLLYEVADHFNLSREIVDYWVKEAIEENDISMG